MIEEAAQRDADRCLSYLLEGERRGKEFVAYNPRRKDQSLGSFSYNTKNHCWSDFATGDSGYGLISLWAYVRVLSYVEAAHDLAAWLGGGFYDPDSYSSNSDPKPSKPPKVDRDYVNKVWGQSLPPENSPVATYLKTRAITGVIPPSIRYWPIAQHKESGKSLPVMLAAVRLSARDDLIALHRTFLKSDGSGKADVSPNKKMLGPVIGGAVALAEPKEILAVGEGIETCLSFQQATGVPTWAALSTSGFSDFL